MRVSKVEEFIEIEKKAKSRAPEKWRVLGEGY
jgi:hypothetical protein